MIEPTHQWPEFYANRQNNSWYVYYASDDVKHWLLTIECKYIGAGGWILTEEEYTMLLLKFPNGKT